MMVKKLHLRAIFFVALFCFATFGMTNAQPTPMLAKPVVDQRVELLSLVFRLAGNPEYNMEMFSLYVERIKKHFEAHKDHPLIRYINTDLKENGVMFDAVMQMALNITPPPQMEPIVPFTDKIPEARWGKEKATEFLKLLNQFYVDADCATFFEANQDLYEVAVKRFLVVFNELDLDWYKRFYGTQPKGHFSIVIGLGNGGANYGFKRITPEGEEIVYAVMGTWTVDPEGMPIYQKDGYLPTMIHEFNHSFVNHLVEQYQDDLKPACEQLFVPVAEQMSRQAYPSWLFMTNESVVRAAVIKYMIDHNFDPQSITQETITQIDRGFLWTKELVEELERYDQKRDTYPTLESYMPPLAAFFEKVASNVDHLTAEIDKRRPKIIEIKPFANGDQQVDPTIKKIEFIFDQPLTGEGYSINTGEKGMEAFPEVSDIAFSEDKQTLILMVALKPGKDYEMVFTGRSFRSKTGYSMNPYPVSFRTKK
ncbi:MAG: DUF4932 domain-containing protein [Bacteroidales bacterium]|nr:DUF4932 domain-containing protein [Bacteroidales bacterium]